MNKGFSGLFVLFALFSTLGYLLYGDTAESNVLLSLPKKGTKAVFANVAQLGMVIVCTGVYPIMMSPMIAPVRSSETLRPWTGLVTIGIVMSSAVAALFCKLNEIDLGTLNVVNGSLCAGVFVGVVPALIGTQILGRNQIVMGTLAVVGLILGIAGLVWTDNETENVFCLHDHIKTINNQ